MKAKKVLFALPLLLIFVLNSFALSEGRMAYKPKGKHEGGDVTPKQAYEMLRKDPENVFLVDVRTRYEYQDIGHPAGAYNIPFQFYTTSVGKKGYAKTSNDNFCSDLKARFNTGTDTLLFICRSGKRAVIASTAAVECGFGKNRVFSIMGGFEGDKVKDKASPDYGKRMVNGWRMEGLPWTYLMDADLMYQPDVKAAQ
jgi:rhodanese-related sulfurtransferase